MPLENATYISDLVDTNPASTDQIRQADDHLRLVKKTILNTFPNVQGEVTVTQDDLNTIPYLCPIGVILAWYGSSGTVPSGWHICDGTTGISRSDGAGTINVPDLRDRTIVGAKTAGILEQGATAGAATASGTSDSQGSHAHSVVTSNHTHTFTDSGHTLSLAEIPAHQHGSGVVDTTSVAFAYGSQSPSSNAASQNISTGSGAGSLEGLTQSKGGGSSHSHSGTTDTGGGETVTSASNGAHTHSTTVSTIQPSMGLHWIMRV